MKHTNPRIQAEIRAEAVEWLVTFSEGDVDAGARRRFNDWLRTSPEHVRTYLRVSAFWQDADRIAPSDRRDIEELVRQASAESNVEPLAVVRAGADTMNTPRRSSVRLVAAAAAVLLIVTMGIILWALRVPTYTTQVGELRTVTLDDGSTVTLNAASAMKVRFTRTQRLIDLEDGQALFHVFKDSARPFVVRHGATRVTAVGTQFDVNLKSSDTVVTVLEGRVAVAGPAASVAQGNGVAPPMLVSAGEQATIKGAQASKHRADNPSNTTAWTTGLLVFESDTLSDVARAFNRQNTKHLIVADPELQGLRVSGVFPSTGAARMAEFLRDRFGVRVVETDAEIRIEKP